MADGADEQSEQVPEEERPAQQRALLVAPDARVQIPELFAPGAHPARFVASSYAVDETPAPRLRPDARKWLLVGICALLLVSLFTASALVFAHVSQPADAGVARGERTSSAQPHATAPISSGAVAPLPPGLPTHFAFGLQSGSNTLGLMNAMRGTNGTAWDFRYQYLSGGVDTGRGWETWDHPSGSFAKLYAAESSSNRYLPVFVYYEMLQSGRDCAGCNDAGRDLAHLDDPAVMRSYFGNWRLLMRQLGAYGKSVVVIVEPDLWGYMQQSLLTPGGAAAKVPASVAASGDADARRFPNTAQGFAWTLLSMRDTYAPNALLALHVSNWATGDDLNTSTNPLIDVRAAADQTAQFLSGVGLSGNPAHVSSWDLLSNDIGNQDSGQGVAWWDRANQAFPNFSRYLSFASRITALTGRRMLLWQVPEGNQYFATMNNTAHHTQDNRAEYILGHVGDFARAGILGVLFGAQYGGTSIDDAAGDGVSNFPPVQAYACDRCNSHLSAYPDDDGGYLRLFVGAYYQHGALPLAHPATWTPAPAPAIVTVTPLPAGTCVGTPTAVVGKTSSSPNPVSVGQTVTVTTLVTVSCDTDILVQVEIDNESGKLFSFVQDNIHAQQNTPLTIELRDVIPTTLPAGTYLVTIGVHAPGYRELYAWDYAAAKLIVR